MLLGRINHKCSWDGLSSTEPRPSITHAETFKSSVAFTGEGFSTYTQLRTHYDEYGDIIKVERSVFTSCDSMPTLEQNVKVEVHNPHEDEPNPSFLYSVLKDLNDARSIKPGGQPI